MRTCVVLLPCVVAALAAVPAAAQRPTVLVVPGYLATDSGSTMAYHSPHPDAPAALLARATREVPGVGWRTDTVPADLRADTVAFVWLMGLSASKGVQRFELSAGATRRFAFTTAADSTSRGFTVAGPDGSSLTFRVTMVDRYGDLFGYATLKLARSDVTPGRPVALAVRGDDAGSRAWYMTFQQRFSPHPRIRQNPVLLRGPGGAEAELFVVLDDLEGGGTASVEVSGSPPVAVPLVFGGNAATFAAGSLDGARERRVVVRVRGRIALDTVVRLGSVAQRDLYVLPYSHNDIGYSDLQENVERLQWRNIEAALELIDRTRGFPEDARYRWNVEILWPVESWLRQAPAAQRARFLAAVREGSIGLNAFLGGAQTGLATAPEMTHFFEYARRLREREGLPVTTAVISDIPGQSWGVVTALRESGVRWFALAPNNGDRIGYTIETWGDRPFWWTSQSGQDSVLMWVAGASYSLFHDGSMRQGGAEKLYATMRRLAAMDSPYRQVQLPYTINGDNGPNDSGLSDFVRDWDARYVSPRLIIATHARMFRDLEAEAGRGLPVASGDFTTYWDDGAASTAAEVELARRASDRLVQAEALWAMRDRESFPADDFYAAWRNVVLWDEHTWGAAASVENPDAPDVLAQWAYKRGFVQRADSLSRWLLARALELPLDGARGARDTAVVPDAFDVANTTSWTRTDVVYVPAELSGAGDRVVGSDGRPVPSQRLSRGRLAVLVSDLPPLSARRYRVRRGAAWVGDGPAVTAAGSALEGDAFHVEVDTATGAVASLVWKPRGAELVDRRARHGLGEYLYVPGRDSAAAAGATGVRVQVREPGPLVATLAVTSAAPGARVLLREVSVAQGTGRVDLTVALDKLPVREKEAVHVAFPFLVPSGQVRFDVASGIVRPDSEQLAGSVRNFVTVQSWADVSGEALGVTWATPSAPLVELGGLFAERPWMRSIPPTQTLISYAMNNYWHTNFKAEQGGPAAFVYALRPHGVYRAGDAVRFGAERRGLLVVAPARGPDVPASLFTLGEGPVVATSVRPTGDGRGWLVALYNPGSEPHDAAIRWRRGEPVTFSRSDGDERPGGPIAGPIGIAAHGTLVLRVDREAGSR